ncbi:MAG: Fic family protein [Bacteroidota bacterium]|jgi:prophage maintenance system killer protein|nr:Fic family protein [Bacteroidota bacterium]NLP19146.1 Fic family protein [Bacteroidales bacterium]OQC43416.1 MAG: Fic/DOC family protein [Bacteroidetes bacterium ADurb.Bin028]HNY44473.1 Fic family protein [Bacteroidales bacterium]HQB22641.1 Fic family protein [Bacteroidales bacterium]
MIDNRKQQIIDIVKEKKQCSSKEIYDSIGDSFSYSTLKRILTDLITDNYLLTKGQGKGTKYLLSPAYELICPIDIEKYFEKEIDERIIIKNFNINIITEVLDKYNLFTEGELKKLATLQKEYQENISQLSENEYKKELERLAIDLSWKSSQIEGNTYTLLETERLLKEKETAYGKTKEEAVMLLNHKDALDFIIEHKDYLSPLTVSKIEDIHSILIKELAIEKNLRKRRVGISGTNYKPLDNEFQILEALKKACDVINRKESVFEKALLALVLISYIQPFMDGNKRTARLVSNAILMNYGYCPLSFRTVDSIDYKKAMLLFYEQNNISNLKNIFIDQFEFAVGTYF